MRFITTVWQLSLARSPKSASERPPCANPPGRGEDHKRVSAFDKKVTVNVIAVNNPTLTTKQGPLFFEEFAFWYPDPTRIPTMEVERDKGKASLRR